MLPHNTKFVDCGLWFCQINVFACFTPRMKQLRSWTSSPVSSVLQLSGFVPGLPCFDAIYVFFHQLKLDFLSLQKKKHSHTMMLGILYSEWWVGLVLYISLWVMGAEYTLGHTFLLVKKKSLITWQTDRSTNNKKNGIWKQNGKHFSFMFVLWKHSNFFPFHSYALLWVNLSKFAAMLWRYVKKFNKLNTFAMHCHRPS